MNTQRYVLQVLYDDVLARPVVPSLTFADINGWPLLLPPLVFPFRRAMHFKCFHAYDTALKSRRLHTCADASNPCEEEWEALQAHVVHESECGEGLFFSKINED